jgi:hypothetical protein
MQLLFFKLFIITALFYSTNASIMGSNSTGVCLLSSLRINSKNSSLFDAVIAYQPADQEGMRLYVDLNGIDRHGYPWLWDAQGAVECDLSYNFATSKYDISVKDFSYYAYLKHPAVLLVAGLTLLKILVDVGRKAYIRHKLNKKENHDI